jgi:hypothetical protein
VVLLRRGSKSSRRKVFGLAMSGRAQEKVWGKIWGRPTSPDCVRVGRGDEHATHGMFIRRCGILPLMNLKPAFTLTDVQCAVDAELFERARTLYEKGGVRHFTEHFDGYDAEVTSARGGSGAYHVHVSQHDIDRGFCNCYMGRDNVLCKHMLAVGLFALYRGAIIPHEDVHSIPDTPVSSGVMRELSSEEVANVKKDITKALSGVRPYSGNSAQWFVYTHALHMASRQITAIVSNLPVCCASAKLCVDILVRLERKLMHGVDDSDGAIGNCMEGVVHVLLAYIEKVPACAEACKRLVPLAKEGTSFGWEEPLVACWEKQCGENKDR